MVSLLSHSSNNLKSDLLFRGRSGVSGGRTSPCTFFTWTACIICLSKTECWSWTALIVSISLIILSWRSRGYGNWWSNGDEEAGEHILVVVGVPIREDPATSIRLTRVSLQHNNVTKFYSTVGYSTNCKLYFQFFEEKSKSHSLKDALLILRLI